MSRFCTIEKSMNGNFIAKTSPRPLLAFLCPTIPPPTNDRAQQNPSRVRPDTDLRKLPTSEYMENWFVTALAGAGYCNKHSTQSFQRSPTSQHSSSRTYNQTSSHYNTSRS